MSPLLVPSDDNPNFNLDFELKWASENWKLCNCLHILNGNISSWMSKNELKEDFVIVFCWNPQSIISPFSAWIIQQSFQQKNIHTEIMLLIDWKPTATESQQWCFMSSSSPSVTSVSMSLCSVTTPPVFVSITSEHSADTNPSPHHMQLAWQVRHRYTICFKTQSFR